MAFVKERIRLQTINQIASDRVKNDTELEIKASSPIQGSPEDKGLNTSFYNGDTNSKAKLKIASALTAKLNKQIGKINPVKGLTYVDQRYEDYKVQMIDNKRDISNLAGEVLEKYGKNNRAFNRR